jgi:hypothetical protein
MSFPIASSAQWESASNASILPFSIQTGASRAQSMSKVVPTATVKVTPLSAMPVPQAITKLTSINALNAVPLTLTALPALKSTSATVAWKGTSSRTMSAPAAQPLTRNASSAPSNNVFSAVPPITLIMLILASFAGTIIQTVSSVLLRMLALNASRRSIRGMDSASCALILMSTVMNAQTRSALSAV